MRPTFRKLEVKDIGNLERLVADNIEGIEPGLKLVDSRLLLGQAVIDLVGLDARGSLVLIALDFSADEGLLLRVMDAYSWCLEYPDTVRRLYPMAQVSTSRPPRILFVVERLTDSFLRRIKQLSFLEVDCFEFRHLEVNGASVIYFDLVERLRKSVVAAPVEAPAPAPVSVAPAAVPVAAPRVEPVAPRVERVVPDVEPPKLMVGTAAVIEPTHVERPVAVAQSVHAPVAEPTVVVAPAPTPVPEPASVTLVGAAHAAAEVAPIFEAAVAEPAPASPVLQLEAIEATAAMAAVGSPNGNGSEWFLDEDVAKVAPNAPGAAVIFDAPAESVASSAPIVTPDEPEPTAIHVEPEPIPPMPAQAAPVWAKPQAQPNGGRPYFFAQASKGTSPAEAGAARPTVAAPAAQPLANKAALEVDDRPELESLSFPKDGLSRQWLEFLSQLGATK